MLFYDMSMCEQDIYELCHTKWELPSILVLGELRLGGSHTVTEYEMSGEPYSQKSGWIKHSNERTFHVMLFKEISIRSVVLPVMANIVQSLVGDFKRITVANPGGVQGVRPTLPAIKIL